MVTTKPRILFLDIETKPILAYTWGLWNQNIGLNQIVDKGGLLCFGAKWGGTKTVEFYSEWEHGPEEMVRQAHRLISEAEAIVTYNGDRFDLPKLMGEFVQIGLRPPAPPTSIDVFKTVKKLGLPSGKLAFVGPFLKLGNKVKHEGFGLWIDTMNGDEKAAQRMTKYCLQDVKLLEQVYNRLRPYVKNHPHTGNHGECGTCGSDHLQSRGVYRTKMYSTQRLQCQSCGAWSTGKRTKI